MPLLLRAARVDEVPPGTSRVVKVRRLRVRIVHVGDAWFAFDADTAPMSDRVTDADLEWARRNAARGYRVVVRGPFVHVALDPDRESAPASIQANDAPSPVVG
jgi:hypothetical protein